MTRARAIELLKGIQFCCDFDDCTNAWDCDECVDAFNMAIEALEQEPTAEYSSDVISRQAAIDAVKEAYENDEMFDGYEYRLQELPSAQPFTEEQIQTMQELESAQVEKAYELGTKEKIIRCMDCKYLQKWRSEESAKKFGQTYECARNVLDCPTLEDFCSHAERRTDE